MKALLPVALALVGLGAGVGAGMALKPVPDGGPPDGCADAPCPEAGAGSGLPLSLGRLETVALDLPFVVPVFESERVVAMVVMTVALEVSAGQRPATLALQPRLRDAFLAAMFRHANSGGFDGSFTSGQKIADLKAGLLHAARDVLGPGGVGEVLVTEIVRKDV
jgi:flagellar protein FliL